MIKKSVISLISYDAEYLPDSIKTYYNYVDEIVLGLDKNRVSSIISFILINSASPSSCKSSETDLTTLNPDG